MKLTEFLTDLGSNYKYNWAR